MRRFDDLTELDQCAALARGIKRITAEGCRSIFEFARKRRISEQEAWSLIVTEAGLPDCEIPARLRSQ